MSLYPAPTTNLDSLHDLVAQLEAVSQRWLDDARIKPEPPSTTDISNISITVRRITLIHRDIYKLENPGLAFPASKKSSPTHTQADDPSHNDSDSSEFGNSEFAICNSPRTLTYSREISRYVAARIVASIKSKPEDAADCCPDLYEEMDLMKSNPAYHAETLADMSASPAPANSPDLVNPIILSNSESSPTPTHTLTPTQADNPSPAKDASASSIHESESSAPNPPSENSAISVAPCEHSSSSSVNPSSDPAILSKISSSASSFRNSPFAIRNSPPARSRAGPS